MQVLFYFEKYVGIQDVDTIINYAEQDWEIVDHDKYHSCMVTLSHAEEIETDHPALYAKAINKMGVCVNLSVVQFSYYKDDEWHCFEVTKTGDFEEI